MNKISFQNFLGKKLIEINEMYPILIFDREETLTIECSWRLRDEKTMLLGSGEYKLPETHLKAHEKLSSMLLGEEIKDIRVSSTVSDLSIQFRNGILLEVFSDSNIYENWTLSDGRDFILISLPGGELSLF